MIHLISILSIYRVHREHVFELRRAGPLEWAVHHFTAKCHDSTRRTTRRKEDNMKFLSSSECPICKQHRTFKPDKVNGSSRHLEASHASVQAKSGPLITGSVVCKHSLSAAFPSIAKGSNPLKSGKALCRMGQVQQPGRSITVVATTLRMSL